MGILRERATLVGTDHDNARRGARKRTRALPALVCGSLLLAGCASMPDSGEVSRVDSSPRGDSDSQVRVYGVPPQRGETPDQIVRGFLEATTSDEADFRTAREYLTKKQKQRWKPFTGTTVLSEAPDPRAAAGRANTDPESENRTIVLSGDQLATVDRKHAYKPSAKRYRTTVHLTKEGGEWKIDSPPAGLVLGVSDFQRIYQSVNKYYFASLGPDGMPDVLVADPVYLRKRIDPVTATVRALLEGPTNWLGPVADSRFPSGTRLTSRSLALDDENVLKVRLSGQATTVDQARCSRMAAQLFYTVQDQAAAKLSRVELARGDGSSLCVLSREAAAAGYAPERQIGSANQQYFIDADHRVVSLSESDEKADPVVGPFGEQDRVNLRSVAVARDERTAAGVSSSGRSLYVAALEDGSPLGDPKLVSAAKSPGDGLTAPSWDGLGDLWVADRDPGRPRLLRLRGGEGDPEEVRVPGLGDGRVKALRVSADGVRIALLVERGGHTTLRLGRVERGGSTDKPELSVEDLRPVAPQLEDVVAASWAGGSRLAVVGRESGGVQQLQFMETDGSPSNTGTLPGINGVKAVAASEDERKSLIADSEDGIVRLPPGANWKTLTKEGSAPVYPG
ncbi:LpqB family beta-propeller domain-containing protein [Streptomyces sp. H27-D2]|uniref:LpqB family beta-propeller domain-containing protein n=1 Tax=Streptomyces sp. H27-D2 TaxID=3046304 RepID=UPI002DBE97E7|nr:LpqB family beta-propeller domain-containing protein [Streptomyces sp. H27-D2]MEC4019621.1 LpqB family beta-propeller domain-containing protein [Streptomyces sp. H27-D2]